MVPECWKSEGKACPSGTDGKGAKTHLRVVLWWVGVRCCVMLTLSSGFSTSGAGGTVPGVGRGAWAGQSGAATEGLFGVANVLCPLSNRCYQCCGDHLFLCEPIWCGGVLLFEQVMIIYLIDGFSSIGQGALHLCRLGI